MIKVLLKVSVVIFLAEAIIMVGLGAVEDSIVPAYLPLLDAFALTVLSLFPIYYWVIRPFIDETNKNKTVLKENADELSAVLEAVMDGILSIDASGTITTSNSAAEDLFGYSSGEMVGQNIKIIMTGYDLNHHDRYLEEYSGSREAKMLGRGRNLVGKRKDDTLFPLQISIAETQVHGEYMYTGVMRDMTKENEFTEKLEQQVVELEFQRQAIEEAGQEHVAVMEELMHAKEEATEKNNFLNEIMEITGQGVLVFNSQLLLSAWNRNFIELLNLQENDLREHMSFKEFLAMDTKNIFVNNLNNEEYTAKIRGRIEGRAEQKEYFRDFELEDGKILKVTQRIMDDGSVVNLYRDVTAQRKEEERIKTMALRDGLTGLANRRAFDAQIEEAYILYQKQETPFLLAYIDLDDFKAVNDTHGHGTGDAVLKFVAKSVEKRIRDSDIGVRLGGDEFAIIFHDTDDADLVMQRMDKIIEDIKSLDEIDGNTIEVGASVGLTSCLCEGSDVNILMGMADQALYDAKKRGKGQVCVAVCNEKPTTGCPFKSV